MYLHLTIMKHLPASVHPSALSSFLHYPVSLFRFLLASVGDHHHLTASELRECGIDRKEREESLPETHGKCGQKMQIQREHKNE